MYDIKSKFSILEELIQSHNLLYILYIQNENNRNNNLSVFYSKINL